MSVGMPGHLNLDVFAWRVMDYFEEQPYLVGSAVQGKGWRDVDVRVMVTRDRFVAIFGEPVSPHRTMPTWAALCGAFAALGQQMTGLPIDFQVQIDVQANAMYGGPREAIGLRFGRGLW